MKKYYLHEGAETTGPFSIEELKDKSIKRATPVWTEGMDEWVSAGTVDELKSLFATPPAFKSAPPPYQPEQKPPDPVRQTYSKNIEETVPLRRRLWLRIVATVAACVIGMMIFANMSKDSSYEPDRFAPELTVAEMEAQTPSDYIDAGGKYSPNFLGDKLKIEGFIQNNATVTNYKDAVVQVTFYSKTNSPIATENYTVYEFFPHGTRKSFKLKVKNYRDIESIGWKVVNAKVN